MASANASSNVARGPRGPLKHRCAHCGAGDAHRALLLCTGCRAVRYCSQDHQGGHRAQHKSACSKIKKSRKKLEAEEDDVRHAAVDFMTPANAFETHVGRFWGLLNTRGYMRARFGLLDLLRKEGTLDGVKEALSHLLDMMRLCRGDNMGLRDMIPAVMLQLDQDQECYDFVKWWATAGQNENYDWGDMALPFLDIKGANVYEDPGYIAGEFGDPHHVAALLLLKLKLLQDNINIRLVRKVVEAAHQHFPRELQDNIENAVVRSPLSTQLYKQTSAKLVAMELELVRHIKILGSRLRDANDSVLFGLLRPDQVRSGPPQMYSPGSPEEMQLVLDYGYAAWWQTQGALEMLENARKVAEKDSADEIEGMMESSKQKHGHSDARTAAEFLDDVSLNRIWGYVDWAVEDTGSLAAERPSDVHIRTLQELCKAFREEDEGFDDSEYDSQDGEQ
ncbi:hypothetical protein DE146DRAFT_361917 [Phaeosphaeria sp. MPI-PUGE-AT-0046c]|nr:hypothetical protein DE146DRAFT_361917 [Phaeosphaeria sp. MPI-PUGE-AT-0046c]